MGWIYFCIVIFVQLAFFLTVAQKLKTPKKEQGTILLKSMVLGIPFGIVFDLMFGHFLGIFSYPFLDFEWGFLFMNGFFSYGIMIATVWLGRRLAFFSFYFLTVVLACVYEVVNWLSPVWQWTFSDSLVITNLVLLFAAYFGLALMMASAVMLFTRERFRFVGG